MDPPSFLTILSGMEPDQYWGVRAAIADVLQTMAPEAAIERLHAMLDDEDKRVVLSVRPGITDMASIVYIRESELLAAQEDPLRYYERVVMPAKLGFTKEATLRRRLPEKQGSELRDVNIWTLFRSDLPGSPVEAYGYTAYDALGRVVP